MAGCCNIIHTPIRGNSVEDSSNVKDSNSQNDPREEDWKRAAYFIDDALHKRGKFGKAKSSTLPAYRQRCFGWVSNNKIRYAIFLVIFAHCILAFFEPPQEHIQPGQTAAAVWVIHAICLTVYIIDISFHLVFYGCTSFWTLFETRRCRGEFILICLFIVDFIILIAQDITSIRLVAPFRCCRFSMIICKSKSCEHIFMVTLMVCKELYKVFLMFMVYLVLFAAFGVHMYANDYHFINCKNTNCSDTWSTNPETGAFDNIGIGFIHIFALLTTENYPMIMIPPFKRTQANFAFFAICVYIGNYVLLAILLAIIVEKYWRTAKVLVKLERERQRKCLAYSWNIIDPTGIGKVSVKSDIFVRVLQHQNNKFTQEEIEGIISFVDFNEDGFIDALEWTIHLCKALSYEFIFDDESNIPANIPKYKINIQKFFETKVYRYGKCTLIILYGVLFTIHWYRMGHMAQQLIHVIRTIITGTFMVECGLYLTVISDKRIRSKKFIFQMVCIVLAAIATILWYFHHLIPSTAISDDYFFGITSAVATCAILLTLPIHFHVIRKVIDIFLACTPVMMTLISVLMIVLYGYCVIGLEAFYGRRKPLDNEGISPSSYDYNCGLGFQTFGCSALIIFQIYVTNDWQAIQDSVMTSVYSKWPSIFFISCFIILNYVLNNLLVAIAIEAYNKLGQKTLTDTKTDPKDGLVKEETKDETETNDRDQFPTFKPLLEPSRRSLTADLHLRHQRNQSRQQHSTDGVVHRPGSPTPTIGSSVHYEMARQPGFENLMTMSSEEAPRLNIHENLLRRRRVKNEDRMKVVMAFRKKSMEPVNLHVNDYIEEVIERKEFIRGRTSRGRTGWFPLECVEMRSRRRKPSRPESGRSSSPAPRKISNPLSLKKNASMKVVKKRDWKVDIHGDITQMNEEELLRINRHLTADLPSLRRQEVNLNDLQEDEEEIEEEDPLPEFESAKINPPPAFTTILIEDPTDETITLKNAPLMDPNNFLSPAPSAGYGRQRKTNVVPQTPPVKDEPPEWAKKFLEMGSFQLRETSRPPTPQLESIQDDVTIQDSDVGQIQNSDEPMNNSEEELRDPTHTDIQVPKNSDTNTYEPVTERPRIPVVRFKEPEPSPLTVTRQTFIDGTHHAVFKFDIT